MLQVTVNGKEEEASEGETLSSLAKRIPLPRTSISATGSPWMEHSLLERGTRLP